MKNLKESRRYKTSTYKKSAETVIISPMSQYSDTRRLKDSYLPEIYSPSKSNIGAFSKQLFSPRAAIYE